MVLVKIKKKATNFSVSFSCKYPNLEGGFFISFRDLQYEGGEHIETLTVAHCLIPAGVSEQHSLQHQSVFTTAFLCGRQVGVACSVEILKITRGLHWRYDTLFFKVNPNYMLLFTQYNSTAKFESKSYRLQLHN